MGIEKGLRQEFPLEKITKDYKLTSIPEPKEAVPKVLPQAPELEVAVLSAMIIDPECIPNVFEILKPECFYKEEHRIIFETIVDLFEAGKSVDLFILNQELKKKGLLEKVGGATYLTEISNAVATSANVEEYAKVIHDKYILREIIKCQICWQILLLKKMPMRLSCLILQRKNCLKSRLRNSNPIPLILKKQLSRCLKNMRR